MTTTETRAICAPADVGIEFTDDAPQELRDTVTAYLAPFLAPIPRNKVLACVCGAPLTGIFGSFSWGLTHGEGGCTKCGHPARAYHVVRDKDGEVLSFTAVLLYAEVER